MEGWHITGSHLIDGTRVPSGSNYLRLAQGVTPKLCARGYHACLRLTDALPYARGTTICRVKLLGGICYGPSRNNMVAKKRKILWRVQSEDIFWQFCDWVAWVFRQRFSYHLVFIDPLEGALPFTLAHEKAAEVLRIAVVALGNAWRISEAELRLRTLVYWEKDR